MDWIACADALPELDARVLMCESTDPDWIGFGHRTKTGWLCQGGRIKPDSITHWMPYPIPPKP